MRRREALRFHNHPLDLNAGLFSHDACSFRHSIRVTNDALRPESKLFLNVAFTVIADIAIAM
jgi:hypothetical protein